MKHHCRILAVALATATLAVSAADYPTKPVRGIITFPPGSSTDIVGRIVTQKMGEYWGQTIVADNRGGAGGSIGSAVVARANPDGYTLLINSNAHAVNPSIYRKLQYNTLKDFVDIGILSAQPNVLSVSPSSVFKTTAELINAARARPGSINFASAGVGSGTHLNLEKFKLAAKVDVTHIPYKGSGEVITDLVGGRVDCYFAPISAAMGYLQSGKLRALAVSTARRSGQLPDVPTVAESGVPGFEFALWFGLWAPAKTPAPVVGKISKDLTRALQDPATRNNLEKLGNQIEIMTPATFAKRVRQEVQDFAQIIKAAGIKPQ